MNPYSGEIEYFNPGRAIPRGWLALTEEEAQEFATPQLWTVPPCSLCRYRTAARVAH